MPLAVIAQSERDAEPLPAGALIRLGSHSWRHATDVNFISFTADNKAVLTASRDHIIRLWDLTSGKEIRRFELSTVVEANAPPASRIHRGRDAIVAVSRDGKTLAAALPNNVIQIWDVHSGKEIRQFRRTIPSIATIRFSNSGKTLVCRDWSQELTAYDLESGREKRFEKNWDDGDIHPGCSAGIAFSPDDRLLANGRMGSNKGNIRCFVQLVNSKSGAELRRFDTDQDNPAAIAFSPRGETFAYSAGDSIIFRDTDNGKEVRRIKTPAPVTALVFARDGKVIVCKSLDQQARVWNAASGELIHEWGTYAAFPDSLRTRASEGRDLTVSADGKVVAWGDGQVVRRFDLVTGKDLAPPIGHRAAVSALHVSGNSKSLITYGEDNTLRRWDLNSGKQLVQIPAPPGTITAAIGPDGKSAALAHMDGTIRLVELTTGKETRRLNGHPRLNFDSINDTADLVFSADGKFLASQGSFDNTVRIFNAAQGTQLHEITIQPAGKPDPAIAGIFYRFRVDGGQGMAFSADGQTLAVHVKELPSRDFFPSRSQLRRWDVTSGKELPMIELAKGSFVTELAYSPDGRLLAAIYLDQTISLFETATGRERTILGKPQPSQLRSTWIYHRRLEPAPPKTLVFSPDGRRLLSRSPIEVIRIWDIHAAEEIGQLKGHLGPVLAAAFTSDGQRIVTGGNDTTVLIWDARRFKCPSISPIELADSDLDVLWHNLLIDDSAKAFVCIQKLTAASKQTVPFLRQRIKPAVGDSKQMRRWIAELDSVDFRKRNAAAMALENLGDIALPALRAAHDSASLEAKRRIEPLLEKLTNSTVNADNLRILRGVEILERINSADARQLLQALASGNADSLVARQAKSALDRIPKQIAP